MANHKMLFFGVCMLFFYSNHTDLAQNTTVPKSSLQQKESQSSSKNPHDYTSITVLPVALIPETFLSTYLRSPIMDDGNTSNNKLSHLYMSMTKEYYLCRKCKFISESLSNVWSA